MLAPNAMYLRIGMKKRDIALKLAQKTGVSPGEAADQVDHMVNAILHRLRSGHSAKLLGFGQFDVTAEGSIKFHKELDAKG